jgi:hypothetical protein
MDGDDVETVGLNSAVDPLLGVAQGIQAKAALIEKADDEAGLRELGADCHHKTTFRMATVDDPCGSAPVLDVICRSPWVNILLSLLLQAVRLAPPYIEAVARLDDDVRPGAAA